MLANKHKALKPTDFFTCSESDNLQSLMERMSSINNTVFVALDCKNTDFAYKKPKWWSVSPKYSHSK